MNTIRIEELKEALMNGTVYEVSEAAEPLEVLGFLDSISASISASLDSSLKNSNDP